MALFFSLKYLSRVKEKSSTIELIFDGNSYIFPLFLFTASYNIILIVVFASNVYASRNH